ncbi:enoyl-CoA hydratase [Caulobacter vibrioides]|uniref:Enoyl-CoA hydratase/isomerase family protein n=2 Tax=Caulobacter vibrioides TaxID=155892 RepID=Q9AB37_CAUVC|nr:enoyl-CoA hydratase [Caulobacter vibrioides]YP_002515776.1 enoyl-CoA hydratase [Caulobacter vibrioides NA1000]AAK22384.1 enoyl-CoA hydratase/isomerase family protein [Caulobacter vibrioides CB15]ACL93868.1 enoyl-CoA hydratase [Caulobacter vibrioides NA1000]ATC27227.1 enoyl-CoA hydratase [Caulobacter vibrioides]QXZ52489.1 enoyl-CoA hydratase [Caulobacter vibrioides]
MTDHVTVQIDAGVMTLTLARPEKKNALSNAMYGVLADSLEAAEKDPTIRVVVFQGDGDSFTAGNDLQDFAAQATGAFSGERHVTRFLKALANATRPLVAAVQGQAVGVGTTMLLHCDLVFVSPDARLTTPFVNLALVPEAASSWLLPARVGHARAYAMFALGEAVDGATAVAWGLANALVEQGDLRARARAAADQLAKRPLGALTVTKRLMRDAEKIAQLMDTEGAEFAARLQTAEAREAFMAFAERRAPDFSKAG